MLYSERHLLMAVRNIVISTSVCLSVCLSVCPSLSAMISPEPHARSLSFCACCLWLWLGPPPAGWRNLKRRAVSAVFFPIDNTLYSIAFATHAKTAEPIEMPFGMAALPAPVAWRCRCSDCLQSAVGHSTFLDHGSGMSCPKKLFRRRHFKFPAPT